MPFFETRRLNKTYRTASASATVALDDVTLSVERNSLTVIHGPSGSGKTTLLALLAALERPTRGNVIFDGKSLETCSDNELARVRRRIGFVYQDFALIARLSVEENIHYALIPRGIPRGERRRRTDELLARFGLETRAGARASELSGGEQQRVALVRALAGQPEVLLADEPTSNLDPAAAQTALAVVREFHTSGRTVVVASHDPALLTLATRVVRLERGRLVPEA